MTNAYDQNLDRNPANFTPLTPLSFFSRARRVFGHRPAYIYGNTQRSWEQVFERCNRFAVALNQAGIGKNDTVAFIAPNIPEMFEAQFAVPMAGAVLNPINIRLDANTIAYILEHGQAKALFTDSRFAGEVKQALQKLNKPELLVIDIVDIETDEPDGEELGSSDYDSFLNGAKLIESDGWHMPADEWDAISLNYTSGTTSDPKGVVVHHRGAYLIALGTIAAWPLTGAGQGKFPVHMYVVPLFHCNGWGHA